MMYLSPHPPTSLYHKLPPIFLPHEHEPGYFPFFSVTLSHFILPLYDYKNSMPTDRQENIPISFHLNPCICASFPPCLCLLYFPIVLLYLSIFGFSSLLSFSSLSLFHRCYLVSVVLSICTKILARPMYFFIIDKSLHKELNSSSTPHSLVLCVHNPSRQVRPISHSCQRYNSCQICETSQRNDIRYSTRLSNNNLSRFSLDMTLLIILKKIYPPLLPYGYLYWISTT